MKPHKKPCVCETCAYARLTASIEGCAIGEQKIANVEDAIKEIKDIVLDIRELIKPRFFDEKKLTLQSLIDDCHFNYINSNITEQNFPDWKPSGKKLELLEIKKPMSTDEVLDLMKQKGLEPANLGDLLVYTKDNPDEQRKFPIVGLGSVWVDPRGHRDYPYLYGSAGRRGLGLNWIDDDWGEYCRFLARRK